MSDVAVILFGYWVLYQKRLSDALHHSALDARLTQNVVWSDARLPTVDELPPRDTTANKPGGEQLYNIRVLVHS